MSLIHYAEQNNLEKIIELVKNGIDLNKKQHHYYETALIAASHNGNFKIVKYLVQHNCMINEKDNDGLAALMWASCSGQLKIVKYLVKYGADINKKSKNGWTALIPGAFYGRIDVVKYLIKHGAKINNKDIDGTSLTWSFLIHNFKIMKWLNKIVLKRIKC